MNNWTLTHRLVASAYSPRAVELMEEYFIGELYGTCKLYALTIGPWADVKNGFTWKIIIVLKVRAGHGEYKFS